MANFLIQPQADHAADPADLANALFAFDVSDPATITGLTNDTAYVAREFILSPASAAFTPTASTATSTLPFSDDFDSDTSGNYTRFSNTGNLVVAGGVAAQDGAGDGTVQVFQDVGLGTNHRVRATVVTTGTIGMVAKLSNGINCVRGVFQASNGTYRIEKLVGGAYTNLGATGTGQSLLPGDILELEIYDGGTQARLRTSSDGGTTWTTRRDNQDVSDVPSGSAMGMRISGDAQIDDLYADDV